MRTRLVVPAVVLMSAGLLLGACSSSEDHDATGANSSPAMDMGSTGSNGGSGSTMLSISEEAEFSATDVTFAQGMIPHHGQAVQMADRVLDASTNPDVRALAEQVKAAQSPEIEQMTSWLTDWGQTVPDLNAVMDDNMDRSGGMMMSGMMSAADLARLDNAAGAELDRMFLEMMILHHEGAIEMAQTELAEGKSQVAKDLAQAVIAGQQAEIDEMDALLTAMPA